MKLAAFGLMLYVMALLLQPVYVHFINGCNSCAASNACSKKNQPPCHATNSCSSSASSHQPVNYRQPHFSITCSSCNPFLVCSGSGFIFSVPMKEHSIASLQNEMTLSANESFSFLFVHELLHPPEYS